MEYDIPYPIYIPYIGPYNVPLGVICQGRVVTCFMGLPFLSFMTVYIQIRLYAVITAAGLTPWTGTDSGVPQVGAAGPFLYLLVTLPLAFELARVYPGYAPYPLRSPLINFWDDNLLTTATRPRDPENAGLPTTTTEASAILQLTTTYLDAHQLLVHPRKLVGVADIGTPAPNILKGEPLHMEDTTIHLGVTQATRHHHITLQSKLEGPLARLPQLARGDLLSTQGLVYFMKVVLYAAIGYQALRLPHPQDALRHARQQVTKAWGQHGGWPTSFPKEAMKAHWRYYGDNTGALVDTAYAKHAAHLVHRVTHSHQPEVRKAAALRIEEAQMARNTCPGWIQAQHGVPTSVGTCIWAQLQLLLLHHTHAILTNHHCDQPGPLVATHTDFHRTPGRRGRHPTPRGGHHHHSIHHPDTDERQGPVRRPPHPVSFRPAMASRPRLPSIPPRTRYEGRARNAGTQGH